MRSYDKNYQKTKKGRLSHKNACKKYEKTIPGFLMRCYRNMKSRILGIQKKKAHLYKDLELVSKEEFYEWSNNNKIFLILYKNWVNSNYDRKLSPSIDRITSYKGYTLDNMQWLTHSENSSKIEKFNNRRLK